jgi:protein-arginine kinase
MKVADVDKLIVLMQPGHMQRTEGADLDSDARDEMRATMLRRKVAAVRLKV